MIVVVNYNMGNLNSIAKLISRLGIQVKISQQPDDIENASKIILPGVGHFGQATYQLKALKLWEPLKYIIKQKKTPTLGICLGMQLLASYSEEGETEGLDIFKATVKKFRVNNVKVPHMGWNTIHLTQYNNILPSNLDNQEFYFAHSYHWDTENPQEIIAYSIYEYNFPVIIYQDFVMGVQFHPEKSHNQGLEIFKIFLKL